MLYHRLHALCLVFLVGLALAGGPGFVGAQPFSGNLNDGDGTPTPTQNSGGEHQIYQNANRIYQAAGLGSPFTNNKGLDPFYAASDTHWTNLTGTVALIGIAAGDSNTFGVYSNLGTGGDQTPLFVQSGSQDFQGAGTLADPFKGAVTTVGQTSTVGFYLNDTSTTKTYYSDASLNGDKMDHMISYQLTDLIGKTIYVKVGTETKAITLQNPYLIAWEDRDIPGADEDFNDMVLLVDKVAAVPVPASFVLFGLGFGGLGLTAWRRRLRALWALAAA
ncbi:MAG: DUF4114 domain-containing protein [Planctomycetia bacterium]|nr:DUF4114 domain-containing protein [Planctomycetia bacterium]